MNKRQTVRGIIIKDNKIMLMYRERKESNKQLKYYSLPGGKIEKNETPEEALVREIKEEFNLDIEVIKYLGSRETNKNIEYFYKCKYLKGTIELIGEEKYISCKDNYYEPLAININELYNLNLRNKDIIKEGIDYNE